MSIESFDRATVRSMIDEMETALQTVASKHGITIKRKSCTYRDNCMPVPFELRIERVTEDGNVETPESRAYTLRAQLFGLKPEWLFESFTNSSGQRFKIVGLVPRRRKFPVVVKANDGRNYKMAAAQVACCMER